MRLVYAAVAVLALSGCVKQMVKPGASPEQMAQDQRECAYEASKATAAVINPFDKGYENARLERMCLEARGYRQE